jgi:VRR-NUC domain
MNAAVAPSPVRQGMDKRITEKAFQQTVIDYARYRGWLVFHAYDSRRSAKGFPDLVLVREQRLVVAELKTMRGKLSLAQQDWASALLHATSCEFHIWRPSDWREIERVLI